MAVTVDKISYVCTDALIHCSVKRVKRRQESDKCGDKLNIISELVLEIILLVVFGIFLLYPCVSKLHGQ